MRSTLVYREIKIMLPSLVYYVGLRTLRRNIANISNIISLMFPRWPTMVQATVVLTCWRKESTVIRSSQQLLLMTVLTTLKQWHLQRIRISAKKHQLIKLLGPENLYTTNGQGQVGACRCLNLTKWACCLTTQLWKIVVYSY